MIARLRRPHHRAYGSVHGGSPGHSNFEILLLEAQKAQVSKALVRNREVNSTSCGATPRPRWSPRGSGDFGPALSLALSESAAPQQAKALTQGEVLPSGCTFEWTFCSRDPSRSRQRVLFPQLEGALLALLRASLVTVRRHVKVRGDANPFNPRYSEYFKRRRRSPRSIVLGATA